MADYPRICLSSTSGSGGKTLLALGLGRGLSSRGFAVKPFKKGPDYIDAAWLGRACGIFATNLDPFFLNASQCRALFNSAMDQAASQHPDSPVLGLVEGNRGLYDGLDSSGSVSTANLARELDCPILLCINCAKSARTVAAILLGLISFEPGLRFGGVILNQIGSPRHETALREAVERHTPLPVLGALPRLAKNPLPERHMGLASGGESLSEQADKILDNLAEFVASHVDVGKIVDIAANAPAMPKDGPRKAEEIDISFNSSGVSRQKARPPRIGYVLDETLWFYYQENLDALRKDAILVKLSLTDTGAKNAEAWSDLDGLYLGGGFPEDKAREISESPWLRHMTDMSEKGMPIYAECGGLMILCRTFERNGESWPMAGVFSALVKWSSQPAGLGYVEARVIAENPFFPLGMAFRGHEFHYSTCDAGASAFALEISRGSGIASGDGRNYDGMLKKNAWGAYTHIFAPAVPCWAPNFIAAARNFRKG